MDFITSIKTCFIKYVEFKGRASLAEFWYFMLFSVLIMTCGDIVDAQIAGQPFWSNDEMYGPTGSIIALLITLPSISVATRRLHDIGKSGWWQLLYLTIVGIIPLIMWFASSTDSKENKYGSPATINSNDKENRVLQRWIRR